MGSVFSFRRVVVVGFSALLGTFLLMGLLFGWPRIFPTGLQVYQIQALPNPPNLTSPANLSERAWNSNITFVWNATDADNNVTSSLFQVSNHSAFQPENITLNLTLPEQNVNVTPFNLTVGRYYWRVRANDSDGASSFSNVWQFDVVYARINISSPVNNSVVTGGATVTIRVNEIENGENITQVSLYVQYNGTNYTYTALNTSNTSVTNYTYAYSVPDINSTTLEVLAYGFNDSQTFNVSSRAEFRITQPATEVGSPNLTLACGFPSNALPNTTINLSVRFYTAVFVDMVNLTVTHPNGTLQRLVEASNNYQKQNISTFFYSYNYTLNGTALGSYSLRAEVRDVNYPSSSAAVSTGSFTVANATDVNVSHFGGDHLELRDSCDNRIVSSGGNITARFPIGLYDLDFWSSSMRVRVSLRNINLSASTNITACNMSDISENVGVPITTRAVDQFELFCNNTLGFTMANLTYNYSGITASITSENDIEFYRCANTSTCSWEQFTLSLLNTTSDIVKINFTNFSVFMLSEKVTPISGGVQSVGSGSSASGSAGGVKIATLQLIKPQSITALENDTIRLPVILENTGDFPLKGIFLKAAIPGNESSFALFLGQDYVDDLGVGKTFETYLDVRNIAAFPGQYEILLTAEVLAPRFKDMTKFFLNLKEKEFSRKESLLEQLEFMQELFYGNPECLEFSEVIGEVSALINQSKYEQAEQLAGNAIDGCKNLVGIEEVELNIPYTPVLKRELPFILVGAVGFLLLTLGFFYFYLRRKPEEW